MKVLLAVDSLSTLDMLLDEVTARSWPSGTEARVVSVVDDAEVILFSPQAEHSHVMEHMLEKLG